MQSRVNVNGAEITKKPRKKQTRYSDKLRFISVCKYEYVPYSLRIPAKQIKLQANIPQN